MREKLCLSNVNYVSKPPKNPHLEDYGAEVLQQTQRLFWLTLSIFPAVEFPKMIQAFVARYGNGKVSLFLGSHFYGRSLMSRPIYNIC